MASSNSLLIGILVSSDRFFNCSYNSIRTALERAFLVLSPLRMERHSTNALAVAGFLENHEAVQSVSYKGLESHPSYNLAQKYLPKGKGVIITFEISGGIEAGKKLIELVQLFSQLANVGDSKSLIIHPASTTHQQLSSEEQGAAGVTSGLIRLSVGTEAIEGIIYDLDQAIKVSQTVQTVTE